MARLKRIDVSGKRGSWKATTSGETVAQGRKKEPVVRRTIATAKREPRGATVRIHKTGGQIQEERTYPGSKDPRRSKG